tara:strand:- start:566 stop:739 length:174 start_codon:yes stop_codon:yes gene_type:complete
MDETAEENMSIVLNYLVGVLSLFIVLYRVIFVMVPMASKALENNDMPEFFKSLTLLV